MTSAVAIAPPRTFLRIPINEWKRKAVHMGAFSGAFLLPYLTPLQALLCVIAVFCGNAFLLPRLMPSIFRPDAEGKLTGGMEVVLYPAAIWATILAFGLPALSRMRGEPQAYYFPVIGVWFMLAVFDALLGLCNHWFLQAKRIAWNPRKSYLAAVTASLLATLVGLAYHLSRPGAISLALSPHTSYFHMLLAGITGLLLVFLLFALIESIWFGIADNLTIPFFATLLLGVDYAHSFHLSLSVLLIPISFALGAASLKKITWGGALLGWIIAFVLMIAQPWLFTFLLGFFAIGIAATKFGFKRKESKGISESRGGRRGAAEIFGAAGVAAWMTPLACKGSRMADVGLQSATDPAVTTYFLIIIAPLIAKTMDTVSSEIGKAVGGKTISLRSFKLVPPGAEGAVSLAGTLAGIAAAALLAALILPLHWGGLTEVAALVVIAILANLFESYWGSWAEPRGMSDGPHTNFLMTLVAATLAWLLWLRG